MKIAFPVKVIANYKQKGKYLKTKQIRAYLLQKSKISEMN